MTVTRLPLKMLPQYRDMMLVKQKNVCAICGETFTQRDDAVVDHCHVTGRLRGILHRSCNGVEGKLLTVATRISKGRGNDLIILVASQIQQQVNVPPSCRVFFKVAGGGHSGVSASDYIVGLGEYLKAYATPTHNLIHPSHHFEFERNKVSPNKANWRKKDGSMETNNQRPTRLRTRVGKKRR